MRDVILDIFGWISTGGSNAESHIGTPSAPPLPMLSPARGRKVEAKRLVNRRVIPCPRPIKFGKAIEGSPHLDRIELIGIGDAPPMDRWSRSFSS